MIGNSKSGPRFESRIVIVFGAGSSGGGWSNGKAAAVAYAREGASVACVNIDATAAAETAAIFVGEGGAAGPPTADFTDMASVAHAIEQALRRPPA
jgi:NAD(P)-dependent dehydrogenase (short-subunit alcohol dehydrogenase family)